MALGGRFARFSVFDGVCLHSPRFFCWRQNPIKCACPCALGSFLGLSGPACCVCLGAALSWVGGPYHYLRLKAIKTHQNAPIAAVQTDLELRNAPNPAGAWWCVCTPAPAGLSDTGIKSVLCNHTTCNDLPSFQKRQKGVNQAINTTDDGILGKPTPTIQDA